MTKFDPKTVYVIYVATTPEKVWQALTSPDLIAKYSRLMSRRFSAAPR